MSEIELLYKELIDKIKAYHPSNDLSRVERAFALASDAHKDQVRKSGEPYIIHPLNVAIIVADLELDMESIVASLLHDVIEDNKQFKYEDIEKLFSTEVADLVDGVTKLEKYSYSNKEEEQADNFRKMFLAMAKDIRVILIKLADRLHNMRTLKFMTEGKQKDISKETLDIYAPLASRLGISKIKIELEDLSFKYLYPDDYKDLSKKIAQKQNERIDYINLISTQIKTAMTEMGIEGTVEGRPKHFFSIYKKMLNQQKTLDQIFDLFAIRVMVDTTKDCYSILGLVHDMYKPMPGRFKDYIAMPKSNMYQSIHNTLVGPTGDPFEIQIRTHEMHRLAEYGIAAHWKYKERHDGNKKKYQEEKLEWLKDILEWQNELSDNKEFFNAVKVDLDIFNEQVYVFTPQGEVIELPKGATPIDFAYKIHSAVGNRMTGAKVNGRIVPFDYEIKNGEQVDIITNNNSKGPSADWLNIVKSTQARNKIRQWFKKQNKTEDILKGRELLEKDANKKSYNFIDLATANITKVILEKFGFNDSESLYAAIGHGGVKESQVVNKYIDEYERVNFKEVPREELISAINLNTEESKQISTGKSQQRSGIIVSGVELPMVRFPMCCNPVPGDEIVCFVTRGRGGTIHRKDCVNIINMQEKDRERLLDAEWNFTSAEKSLAFQAELKIVANDKSNLIVEIAMIFGNEGIEIVNMNVRVAKDKRAIFDVIIKVHGKKELSRVIGKLKNNKEVILVERKTS